MQTEAVIPRFLATPTIHLSCSSRSIQPIPAIPGFPFTVPSEFILILPISGDFQSTKHYSSLINPISPTHPKPPGLMFESAEFFVVHSSLCHQDFVLPVSHHQQVIVNLIAHLYNSCHSDSSTTISEVPMKETCEREMEELNAFIPTVPPSNLEVHAFHFQLLSHKPCTLDSLLTNSSIASHSLITFHGPSTTRRT